MLSQKNTPASSLPEVHRTITIPNTKSIWRKMLAYAGPGYLVSIGYIDPGNWATNIAGGAKFGYTLLAVILISSLMAMLLQSLCVRLGVATGRDLAEVCRDYFSPQVNFGLWFLCEIAIAACDLAELIGSAIALQLLFDLPLAWGVCITALDVIALLFLQEKGFRYIEVLIVILIGMVSLCFTAEILLAHPDLGSVIRGYAPGLEIFQNAEILYIALGILGATVMPHNLYLHSSIVQTRAWKPILKKKWEAVKFGTLDSTLALFLAFFINSAILILSATTFHSSGYQNVTEIQQAHKLLSPLLGVGAASTIFALALLASGQSSTLTGTMAGQIVMTGFLSLRLPSWLRRLSTRIVAVIPALVCIFWFGEQSTGKLLIFSQLILSLQLPFAVFPLVIFTSDRRLMGEFANSLWLKLVAWSVAFVIAGLNLWLLVQTFLGWLR